jgi:DNA-binding YbaB/EbfC family protein
MHQLLARIATPMTSTTISKLGGLAFEKDQDMPDFMGLMKQAAEIKSKMESLQAELERIEVEGNAGGGLVSVTLTAKGDAKGVRIDASLLKPDEKEIVEDLLVAAFADARRKAEALVQEKMQNLTGGLPLQLPPGLKLY